MKLFGGLSQHTGMKIIWTENQLILQNTNKTLSATSFTNDKIINYNLSMKYYTIYDRTHTKIMAVFSLLMTIVDVIRDWAFQLKLYIELSFRNFRTFSKDVNQ